MKRSLLILLAIGFTAIADAQTFTLKSNDIGGQATQKQFLNGFGCTGENISPELHWENSPAGTQSFAVTMYDKDAATGSGFWHWVVYNIPATTTGLASGAGDVSKGLMPKEAMPGINDAGMPGYGGPCPPPGPPHMYIISVYALKSKLTLGKNATPAIVGMTINNNLIVKASLVMYGQQ